VCARTLSFLYLLEVSGDARVAIVKRKPRIEKLAR